MEMSFNGFATNNQQMAVYCGLLASKLYVMRLCGSLYRRLLSPLYTFLHCPPKLRVFITAALSFPVNKSYLFTIKNKQYC